MNLTTSTHARKASRGSRVPWLVILSIGGETARSERTTELGATGRKQSVGLKQSEKLLHQTHRRYQVDEPKRKREGINQ